MKKHTLGAVALTLLVAGCAQHADRTVTPSISMAADSTERASQRERFLRTAVEVTGSFEGNEPWAKITGDFDGQGLTCGTLGYTFANGEQQRIVREFIRRHGEGEVLRLMPQAGADYVRLVKSPEISRSTREISDWTMPPKSHGRVRQPHKRELENFWSSPAMQAIQLEEVARRGRRAEALAAQWGKPNDLRTYCHFYDLVVFHGFTPGELSGQMDAVEHWVQAGPEALFDDMSRWADSLPATTVIRTGERVPVSDIPNLKRNIRNWKRAFASADENVKRLFTQGYVESKTSTNTQFKAVSPNRIGLILFGRGYLYDDAPRDISRYFRN